MSGSENLSALVLHWHPQQPLENTLRSLQDVAGEVIVVQTLQAAQQTASLLGNGWRVISCPWEEDFSAVRNAALEQVEGEWILWLEAGEVLVHGEMMETFLHSADARCAYLVWTHEPPGHPDLGGQRRAGLRLWAARAGLRYQGRVCETPLEDMAAAEMELALAPLQLIHTGPRSPQFRKDEALLILGLLRQELPHAPRWRMPQLLNTLGDMQLLANQPQGAQHSYRQALHLATPGTTDRLESYLGLIASTGPDQMAQLLGTIVQALEEFPRDAQLLCAAGGALGSQGQWQQAAESFRLAARVGQVNPQVWHPANMTEFALHSQAMALLRCGQAEQALQVLEEACHMPGATPLMWWDWMETLLHQGETARALELADQLPSVWGHSAPTLHTMIQGVQAALDQKWSQAQRLLQQALDQGCRCPLGFRYLVLALLNQGRSEAALQVLQQWMQVQPYREDVPMMLQQLQSGSRGDRDSLVQVARFLREQGIGKIPPAPRPIRSSCQHQQSLSAPAPKMTTSAPESVTTSEAESES